ncbi:U3 small nucleolar RNA-associated protein 25 [Macadamia integrifolia]|uniref:U3 small nucleolar RNA-associated protein 25 n=1 Tax=Macadamia integrifolia TaxID=60698 RepID=UPI001C4E4148|nr:U3 small nucleolar RNA-associated protein 25 [Macadamia integrifolia]XP_042498982.1 U3 small nucleolar RNA-associated protein 25 [Macadamia integrifolia]
MGRPYGGRKGLKRSGTSAKTLTSKRSRKNRHIEAKVARSPSPSSSGTSSEEHSNGVASEVMAVYKEPSVYDNLLVKLGKSSDFLADVCRRRQQEEEGRSDIDEEEDGGSESPSASGEEDNSEKGSDSESDSSHAEGTDILKPTKVDLMNQNEETDTEDEDEVFDKDQEHDVEISGQTSIDAPESVSSFKDHLGHKLSEVHVNDLKNVKWKFKWKVPAVGMSMSNWIGTGQCFFKEVDHNSVHGLQKKLSEHWLDVYKKDGGSDFYSSNQRLFFSVCNTYRDIMHCNKKPFYLRGMEEDSSIMDAYIMHALNHVFRTRDLVTKNNEKLAKHQGDVKAEIVSGDEFLDHGFTRPKVLMLLPLASIALRVVKRMIYLTPSKNKVNVEHMDRFLDEFGTEEDDKNDENFHDDKNSKPQKSSKPSDFQALFGGNNNDHFMIGIKFTRKSIKLYSDFYSSDMIVASPLALITKIGEAEIVKDKDIDYLSSIEVLIIDHADVIAMQNWSHVNSVVEQLNHIPSKQHGTDVMRIRHWYLDGHARFYRQTIILGSFINPDINALFNHHCVSYHGKVKLISEYKGVLPKVLLQVRQIYERFDVSSVADADDARLDYFATKIFPKIKYSIEGGIMIFISSYFEFVRIRNFLKSQSASFCMLSEYTKQSDISRARVWFFGGERKIMLYTERAHFYHRYKIRGIQNLIIYSLPERKEFYPEIVNMLEDSHNMACTVLFSCFDQFRLERIVGAEPAKKMVSSEKNIFTFC